MRIKISYDLLFIALGIFLFISSVSAADPGHGAAVIGSGTFESGNYVFPGNLSVSGNVGIEANVLKKKGGNV